MKKSQTTKHLLVGSMAKILLGITLSLLAWAGAATHTNFICRSDSVNVYFVETNSTSDGLMIQPSFIAVNGQEWELELLAASTSKKLQNPKVRKGYQSRNRFTFGFDRSSKLGVIIRNHTLDSLSSGAPVEFYLSHGKDKERKEVAHCEVIFMGAAREADFELEVAAAMKRIRTKGAMTH